LHSPRRRLESVLTGVAATRRKIMARRVQEFRSNGCVRKRVEGEVTSDYDVRRSDEGMGGRVNIVTTSEVTVVGRDDWK
jgi:hypothetical protein